MATADDLPRLALALDGTTAAAHFDGTAYKVVRIYATLAALGNEELADALRMAWRHALPPPRRSRRTKS